MNPQEPNGAGAAAQLDQPALKTITIPKSAKHQEPQPTPHSIKHREICERRQAIIDRGGA